MPVDTLRGDCGAFAEGVKTLAVEHWGAVRRIFPSAGGRASCDVPSVLYIFLLSVVTLVASLFPNHPLSLVVYLGATLYAVVSAVGTVRKATPSVQRDALLASSGVLLVALGVGAFLYFR